MTNTKMIGNKITEARKKMNISQAQLAGFLFISPQAVGKWERGESMPDITTFNRLAEIFNVDLNYFSDSFQSHEKEILSDSTMIRNSEVELIGNEPIDLPDVYERHAPINLTGVNLEGSDFAGVTLHNGRFNANLMRTANFFGADLTGSLFDASDLSEANFDSANLTECKFSISELGNASFRKSVLLHSDFNKSLLAGTKFIDAKFNDVKLTMIDLRKTVFENCIFDGVDFKFSDLRGMDFKGHTFVNVQFDKAALDDVSFAGATLKNVSFRLPFSITNKSYRAFKTVSFAGAMMDKLTYAALKGLWVSDLSKVIVI